SSDVLGHVPRFGRRATPLKPRVVIGLIVLAASGPCAAGEPPPPNILLISLDALRADALSCYGNERPASPFLARLAASGIRFANAQVSTHGTPTSHATMLSGGARQGADGAPPVARLSRRALVAARSRDAHLLASALVSSSLLWSADIRLAAAASD